MTPLEYLQEKVMTILKPSSVEGVGFFAIRDIEIGEKIFDPWTGESGIYSITHEELFTLPGELQKSIYETFDNKTYLREENEETTIVKSEYGRLFFSLIKGCHWVFVWPYMFLNSGLNHANVDTLVNGKAVCIKKIKKGEEILANYGSQFRTKPKNFI